MAEAANHYETLRIEGKLPATLKWFTAMPGSRSREK